MNPFNPIESPPGLFGDTRSKLAQIALIPTSAGHHYSRDQLWRIKGYSTAADRYTLQSPNVMAANINSQGYAIDVMQNLVLSAAASWDTTTPTDYTVAANRSGKDFYVYACQPTYGVTPVLLLSSNSTYPSGYTADNSRKIGGFHCLCVSVGTISGHTLTGFVAGDILPASVWDLLHRPAGKAGPEGMVYLDELNMWVDIYLASGTGASTASAYGGTISDTRNWMDFVDDFAAVGKKLLRDSEFQRIAAGSNEETNIAGSTDPVTTGGHLDTASRRMISHIGCEDCCGVMWQWLDEHTYRYDADIAPTFSAASKTLTVYHAASPGGNPIYLKYDSSGVPYLCCNMATDAVSKVLTFGSKATLRITHDADAATGSYQVYFDEDATQPARLLCALPGLKTEYLRTSTPGLFLQITYNGAPGTPGVALYFDDGADERLEFTSPTSANGTIDTAYCGGPAWGYYDLLGDRGSFYCQGSYGVAVLLAGAAWNRGSGSGSRARSAVGYRWGAFSYVGGRGRADAR